MSSLAAFEVLISLSLNDDSVIDVKGFHKLQTFYLQVMADVRNVARKMKVRTEENFQKNFSGRNNESKNDMEQKWLVLAFACYLIANIIRIMES